MDEQQAKKNGRFHDRRMFQSSRIRKAWQAHLKSLPSEKDTRLHSTVLPEIIAELHETIRNFDQYLGKAFLETLSLADASRVLDTIAAFHQRAAMLQNFNQTPKDASQRIFPALPVTPNKTQGFFFKRPRILHTLPKPVETTCIDSNIQLLISTGCRLSADLGEKIHERMVTLLQGQDSEIQRLSQQLNQHLRYQHQASAMLRKSQSVRELTQETAEAQGLGVVI